MYEETAQADGILSAIVAPAKKKPAAKKKKAKKAKKATAKKPAAKKAKKAPAKKKAAKKKPAAKKAAAKKPAKKKVAKKKVAKKATAKKPAAKKAAKKPAKKKVAKKAVKKTVKKAAKKPAKRKAAKKSVKKPKDGAAVSLKAFTIPASSEIGQASTKFNKGMENLGTSLMSYAQNQIEETVQTAQQLMNCRTIEDLATVQTQFVQHSFDRFVKQVNKLAQSTANMAKSTAEPLQDKMQSFFYANRAA